MKNYDYKLARKIIETFLKFDDVKSVSMGMQEDWFWTAQTVWENGEYLHALPENADESEAQYKKERENGLSIFLDEKDENGLPKINTLYEELTRHQISGIYGSHWATPIIEIQTGGETHTFNCYTNYGNETDAIEKLEKMFSLNSGCLSRPVMEKRMLIEPKEFKQ